MEYLIYITKIIKTGGNSDICPKSNFDHFGASLTVIEIVYVCIQKLMPVSGAPIGITIVCRKLMTIVED